MRFDIVTIFPEFFAGPLDHGIIRRAREAAIADVRVHDLRHWTRDRHRTVDDRPFGGGAGMVLKPEPIFEAVEELLGVQADPQSGGASALAEASATAIVLLSAAGKLFRQADARRFAALERVVLLCGRYEGVDERVADHLASDEISIGDFVLSGGELPAAMVVDAVIRLLPGALGNEDSSVNESFSEQAVSPEGSGAAFSDSSGKGLGVSSHSPLVTGHYLLDCPHYTRPAEFRGWAVPEVLVSGNHEQIRLCRRKMALAKTLRNRPDLLAGAALSDEDRRLRDEAARRAFP